MTLHQLGRNTCIVLLLGVKSDGALSTSMLSSVFIPDHACAASKRAAAVLKSTFHASQADMDKLAADRRLHRVAICGQRCSFSLETKQMVSSVTTSKERLPGSFGDDVVDSPSDCSARLPP